MESSKAPLGSLEIICGPMFAGKSVELAKKISTYLRVGLKVLYINHELDTRSGISAIFSTHDPFVNLSSVTNLTMEKHNTSTLRSLVRSKYDVIVVDEAQFFDEGLVDFCKLHVDFYHKRVIVGGLDGDCNRKRFGHILDLIPLADTVTKLTANCMLCSPSIVPAIFTHRLQKSTDIIHVGGEESYIVLCRACYNKQNV